jgi:ribosomal protein L16/L10AE
MFEVTGLDAETAKKALTAAGKKISVKTTVIAKGEIR